MASCNASRVKWELTADRRLDDKEVQRRGEKESRSELGAAVRRRDQIAEILDRGTVSGSNCLRQADGRRCGGALLVLWPCSGFAAMGSRWSRNAGQDARLNKTRADGLIGAKMGSVPAWLFTSPFESAYGGV